MTRPPGRFPSGASDPPAIPSAPNSVAMLLLLLVATIPLSCGDDPTGLDWTPPATIVDLDVKSSTQGFLLRWTAPGDDLDRGQASRYEIRHAVGGLADHWNQASLVSSVPKPGPAGRVDSVRVSGLGTGPWEFGIKSQDEAGNWSGLSNIVIAHLDTIPPAAVSDLEVRSTARGFYLNWTATGDDGLVGRATRYDIRYAATDLSGAWESATAVPSPPVPKVAGASDSASVLDIGLGPWEFGIRVVDDAGNRSPPSNIVRTTLPEDEVAPAPVTDLRVDLTTEASVVLRWTASGDDGASGQASAYDLRFATSPLTPDTWAGATVVQGVPVPREPGEEEMFAVSGIEPGPTYYFAISVLDESENASNMSNQVSAALSIPTQLTFFTEYGGHSPDWSPDGQSIVLSQLWESQPGIHTPALYVIPASGGSPVQYTSNPDGSTSASWSPDGDRFAFSLYFDESTRTTLAVMDALPGASPRVLVDPDLLWKSTSGARWSPDGARIAFVTSTFSPPAPPASKIMTVAAEGGAPELLAGDGTWPSAGLDWSPDGTRIVYSSKETGSYHLWTIPSNGGQATQLTTGAGEERSPSWSPDGSRIAYLSDKQVWVMDASGGNAAQVTFNPGRNVIGAPSWSPDATAIAYDASTGPLSNIWVLRVR